MSQITIKYTEVGFIDIKRYIYDRLTNYVPLLAKISKEDIFVKGNGDDLTKKDIFISFGDIGTNTNKFGIRSTLIQMDTYAQSVEEVDNIKEIIIDLFNRREFQGIKSILKADYGTNTPSRKGIVRATVDFDFVYKDMKY